MTDRIGIANALRRSADEAAFAAVGSHHTASSIPRGSHLLRAMSGRSAETRFADSPISVQHLLALGRAMAAMDEALWGSLAEDLPLRILIACRNVEALEPGLFEYKASRITRVMPVGELLHLRNMVLQPEFASASAIIMAVGDLEGMSRRFGAHGHRMLLSRGGACCEAGWLSAVDAGLIGSIFAGILPSALQTVAGIDGNTELQILALGIGKAP